MNNRRRGEGEARTGAEALQKALESPPDLALLDYQMPDLNGVDVARQICELFPQIPRLVVTLHLSKQLADAALLAGVRGACAKQDIGTVVEAVEVYCCVRKRTFLRFLRGKAAGGCVAAGIQDSLYWTQPAPAGTVEGSLEAHRATGVRVLALSCPEAIVGHNAAVSASQPSKAGCSMASEMTPPDRR